MTDTNTQENTTAPEQALSQSALLALSDDDFDSVALGLMNAYDFAIIKSGGLYIQRQPDGKLIKLDNDETVKGVFDFCRFVDTVIRECFGGNGTKLNKQPN